MAFRWDFTRPLACGITSLCGFSLPPLLVWEVELLFRPYHIMVHWSILLLLVLQVGKIDLQHIVVPPDMSFQETHLNGALCDVRTFPSVLMQFSLSGLPCPSEWSPCFEITFHESYFLFVPLLYHRFSICQAFSEKFSEFFLRRAPPLAFPKERGGARRPFHPHFIDFTFVSISAVTAGRRYSFHSAYFLREER